MQLVFTLFIFFATLAKNSTITNSENINHNPEWITAWATVGLAIATALLIFFTYRHEKDLVVKQQELVDAQKDLVKAQQNLASLEDQQNKFAALLQIFQLLDNNAHRNARRRIINLYTDESNTDKWDTLKRMNVTKEEYINENFINSNYLESREIVKADFNQIEALIKSGLPPEEFLKSYWLEVLKCYKALEDYRDERSMENFNDLMKRAEEYRKTHHNKVSPPQTMSKDKFKENFRDV